MKPFLKWCGGKRQLLPIIKQYIPKKFNTYYEPFVGAGAVLFELQPKKAIINDLNTELHDAYLAIKMIPISLFRELSNNNNYKNTEENYYRIRNWDRQNDWPNGFYWHQRVARTIYLNKTGFNGLYRVNSKNQFNVPYGKYKNDFNPDIDNLKEISNYLNQNNDIYIWNFDFEKAVKGAQSKDFIYLDPPYDPISDTSNFTSYTSEGFNKNDQIRLRDCFKGLSERGCYCMLSNAGTDFIKDLYKDFNIVEVKAKRNINCDGSKRGEVSEVLIMNYNNQTTH